MTGRVLLFLFEKIGDEIFAMNHPYLVDKLGVDGAFSYLEYIHKKDKYVLSRLEKNGLIEKRKIGNEVVYKITRNGKVAALQLIIARAKHPLPNDQILLVTFDVPEVAKLARRMFRHSLKNMGFKMSQFSVWSTNRDVVNEMKQYIKQLKIDKWVFLYMAKRIPCGLNVRSDK